MQKVQDIKCRIWLLLLELSLNKVVDFQLVPICQIQLKQCAKFLFYIPYFLE